MADFQAVRIEFVSNNVRFSDGEKPKQGPGKDKQGGEEIVAENNRGDGTGGDDNTAGFNPTGGASTCGDDEDGISFTTPMVPGTTAVGLVNQSMALYRDCGLGGVVCNVAFAD